MGYEVGDNLLFPSLPGSVQCYISSTHRREYSLWMSVSPLKKHIQNNLILGNLISNHLCTQLEFMERKRA